MKLTEHQQEALKKIYFWLKQPRGRTAYQLFGYAGTGKTTLARMIAKKVEGEVIFCAFTGKAVSVLEKSGCKNCMTIHKMMYTLSDHSKSTLIELQKSLDRWIHKHKLDNKTEEEIENLQGIKLLRQKIKNEEERLKQPRFHLNQESIAKTASLIIVDECSMVDERIGNDLLSFGVPVLALGDPGQLPPVKGKPFFNDPDYVLRHVCRQALDNPIISIATAIRKNIKMGYGQYKTSFLLKEKPTPEQVLGCDQIIVGTNKTRKACNKKVRFLLGRDYSSTPVPGDKIICLKNNHEIGLLNGTLWTVLYSEKTTDVDKISLTIEDDLSNQKEVIAHTGPFEDKEIPFWELKEAEHFDYGYAITCHKAQGSEWDSVCIFDESWIAKHNKRKWLYTAVTRARKRIVLSKGK